MDDTFEVSKVEEMVSHSFPELRNLREGAGSRRRDADLVGSMLNPRCVCVTQEKGLC